MCTRARVDFTSALYLGLITRMRLRPSRYAGKPAALSPPPESEAIADQLARLIGCERATLGTSTLHLFWDLFGQLSRERIAIYVDAGTTRSRGGAWSERWRAAHWYAASNIMTCRRCSTRYGAIATVVAHPIVVTDGFCPGCGRHAPLAAYLESVRAYGGRLIIDDTQALGIYGRPARGCALRQWRRRIAAMARDR